MPRILRLSTFQRNILACIALFIVINALIVSEYSIPRKVALSLDDIYDPLPSSLEVDANPTPNNSSRILLVSALFLLPISKEEYLKKLPQFFGPITTDIYFFTTPGLASTISTARGAGLPLTIDTSFSSPFDIPPLKGREAVYKAIHARDKEREFHVPALYALRNAKPFFVKRAVERLKMHSGKEYDYVFWNDASSFKEEHFYSAWPDRARVDRIWEQGSVLAGVEKRDLVFFPMMNSPPKNVKDWTEDLGPVEANISQGSFFGGSPVSMTWFSGIFYSYHDHFLKLGYASIRDNTAIYNALLLLHPSRFITVWMNNPSAPAHGGLPPSFLGHGHLGACGDGDYYYQWWLSDRETREKMRRLWMTSASDSEVNKGAAAWWKIRTPCRFTRVLAVEGVLMRVFGQMWRRPAASVMRPTRTW